MHIPMSVAQRPSPSGEQGVARRDCLGGLLDPFPWRSQGSERGERTHSKEHKRIPAGTGPAEPTLQASGVELPAAAAGCL